jgi:SAM-dependent methyltransferase
MISVAKKVFKRLFQRPFDALLANSTRLPGQTGEDPVQVEKVAAQIKADPSFPARFWPLFPHQASWIIPKNLLQAEIYPLDGLPVPPSELFAGYGGNAEEYLASGRDHFERMKELLAGEEFKFEKGCRVLDFGCAAGRMTRCLGPTARERSNEIEVWGVDQSAGHIRWCQRYLSPPFKFLTCTTFPHLPFEDNTFDLIFACSVFTHIGDLEDAWLMELRRISRPGAFLYITVHDNRTIDILLSSPPGHWLHDTFLRHQLIAFEEEHHFLETGFQMFLTSRSAGNCQVYHDRDYIQETWGKFFEIVSFKPEAYGYQTAVILRKSLTN